MARFGYGQELRQVGRQEMQLQPRMLQAIEVLQLARGELDAFLREALQENEALGLDEPPPEPPPPAQARGSRQKSDAFDAWLENQPGVAKGLVEHLQEEIGMLDVDDELLPWVHLVVSSLDPSGYLTISDEALLALARERGLEPDPGRLGRAIAVVQGLEPRGIGGRDAVESLLLQLDPGEPDYGLLCRLIEEFLDDVARNKLPLVARELEIDLERLEELLVRLRQLELTPGAELSGADPPPIRPDVIVVPDGAGFEIRIDQSGLPALRIDAEVERLARDRGQPGEVRRYLRNKIERARWLIDALEQRLRTLQRTAVEVFVEQKGFLERGPSHLVPLRMTDLAERLGIHVSTVSRAVAGKYVDTPWGVFPMRSFFQGAAGGSERTVRGTVQDELRAIVEGEDPHQPLSDEELALALEAKGYDVARRTVAKYRRELGIPSSYRRRKYTG